MKMFRMVGDDQRTEALDLGGPLGVGWLCAFFLGPQRSAHSLGTERYRCCPCSPRPLAMARSLLLPGEAPSPPPLGFFWCEMPRPRLTPQPGKTVPAYLLGFSGGIQVEMSVSLSFIWWVTL